MNLRSSAVLSVAALSTAALGVVAPAASAAPSDPSGQTCVTATFNGGSVNNGAPSPVIHFTMKANNATTPAGEIDYAEAVPLDSSYSLTEFTVDQQTITSTPDNPQQGSGNGSQMSYQAPAGFQIASGSATACKPGSTDNGGGSGSGSGNGGSSVPTCYSASLTDAGTGSESGRLDKITWRTNSVNDPQGRTDFVLAGALLQHTGPQVIITSLHATITDGTATSVVASTDPPGSQETIQAPNGFYITSATATACDEVTSGSGGSGGTGGTGGSGSGSGSGGSGASGATGNGATGGKPTYVATPVTSAVTHQVPVGQQHSGSYDSSWTAAQWTGLSLMGAALIGSAGFIARRRHTGRV